jgi:acyl carrier protein
MKRQEIITKVVQTIVHIQEESGRSSADIGVSTRPVGGVEGFDSLSGVEATVMLSESLGVRLPEDYNPFISKDGKRALSVREIADSLSTYVGTLALVG